MRSRLAITLYAFSLSSLSLNAAGSPDTEACLAMVKKGLRPVAATQTDRFLGKVQQDSAQCRGGERALQYRNTPWVDWSNYWSTGDASTQSDSAAAITRLGEHLKPNGRGIDGALMDLEYQRIELIKFNLFDNYTYPDYVTGRDGREGRVLNQWPEMRLSADHNAYQKVGGNGAQRCGGELIRHRTTTGICNDIFNPRMGSTGTLFSRNVEFDSNFPRLGKNPLARARHSDSRNGLRIGLLKPDPQRISRELFTRPQDPDNQTCNRGHGMPDQAPEAQCDYQKAPFFNVLAAFWIQFMTHDWFSHLDEGRNQPHLAPVGCDPEAAPNLGCRPGDRREPALVAVSGDPQTFQHDGKTYLRRAYEASENKVTAWWDASQIYGYDALSVQRVRRDPADTAKLLQEDGYLPVFRNCDPNTDPDCTLQPQWLGQEAAAFPDNWNIGLSFYHNLFVREHNAIVTSFRGIQTRQPGADAGLRHPDRPDQVITYSQVSDEELFQIARLIVSAEIAKIHTIEWTTQLLYNDPAYRAMNSNWFGLFESGEPNRVSKVLRKILGKERSGLASFSEKLAGWFGQSDDSRKKASWYSVLASGAGIFGLGSSKPTGALWWKADAWRLDNPAHVNGGVNHFGSPFNFPEEFTTVYRLHPLVPDLIELRDSESPNQVQRTVPVIDAVRGKATAQMRSHGIANWAVSLGRQRLGLLHLNNHPLLLQNLPMPHLESPTRTLDIAALDLIRDRERGIPRFNEFRRQIGLKSLRSFDDFIDQHLDESSPARQAQAGVVTKLRHIYGTHVCDKSRIITHAQRDEVGNYIDDCLGHPDGTVVDNIEDVDTVVGWLAEYTRPHGFAISETQFHIFIINASRRLFSDRFFTSGFRPEFYSHFGLDWVNHNGPVDECPYPVQDKTVNGSTCLEPEPSNGHTVPVSPLKRLLLRNIPELRDELMPVVNVFDPWARDRGEFYSLEWKPRPDAASDPAF